MRRLALIVSFGWCLAAFVPLQLAAQSLGPLDPLVDIGESDGWTGSRDGDAYWLENAADPGAIRYYFGPHDEAAAGSRTIETAVSVQSGDPQAGAGLLYGYRENPRRYFLIVVSAVSDVAIFSRDEDGFTEVMRQSFEPAGNAFTTIQVQEQPGKAEISINGEFLAAIESQTIGAGAAGIAAVGQGRFGFRSYGQSASRAEAPEPGPSLSGPRVFKEHTLADAGRGGFPAFHLLVPEGWTIEGGVDASGGYHRLPYLAHFRVTAPDGRFVSVTPFIEFGYSDNFNAPPFAAFDGRIHFRMPGSLGEFLRETAALLPENGISDIEVISETVDETATDYVRQINQQSYASADDYNRQWGHTGERFVYDIHRRQLTASYDKDGMRLQETSFATVASSIVQFPGGGVKNAMWSLGDVYAVGGPPGSDYADDPELMAVVRSIRMNPDWAYAIDQWYKGQRELIIREGMARIASDNRQWSNTRATQTEDVLDISFNGWKSRNAANDAGHSSSVNAIHERTTYATPAGGTVNLPSFYNNVYTNGLGEYVLHNDAFYQINNDPTFNSQQWQRIEPAPPQ